LGRLSVAVKPSAVAEIDRVEIERPLQSLISALRDYFARIPDAPPPDAPRKIPRPPAPAWKIGPKP